MDIEITKREIIVSISIVAVMLTFGIFISSSINDSHLDKVQEYNTALPIDTQEMFEYLPEALISLTTHYLCKR